jgi:hypothetical protein
MAYNYTKSGVQIPDAFQVYLTQNYPLFEGMTYTDPDLEVYTSGVLDGAQEITAQSVVDAYVDPAEYLTLNYTATDHTWSKATTESTPTVVETFIFSPNTPNADGGVFDAVKTVMSYTTDDVTLFETGPTACTITFQIYDATRNLVLTEHFIDISDILEDWQADAIAQGTGSRIAHRTFMAQALRHVMVNYDTIWQLRYATSDSRVKVRSHGFQSLYYNVQSSY